MSPFRIPSSALLPISILITLMNSVDANCDSCKNYFCPLLATSPQIMSRVASGSSLFLDVSPPAKQSSDDHPQYLLPNIYQPDHHPPQNSEETKPMMTLPSCLITIFILFATLSKIGIHIQVRKTAAIFPLVLVSMFGSLIGGLLLYKSHSISWDPSLSSPSAAEKYSLGIVYLSILFLLFLLPRVVSLEQAALRKLTFLLFSSLIFYQVFGSTVTILHCLLLTSIILPCNTVPLFLISKHVQTSKVFYCMISQESLLSNAVSLILYHLISVKSNFDETPEASQQPVSWYSSVICVLAVGIEGTLFTFCLSYLLFMLTKHCSPYIICFVEVIALLIMSSLAYFSVHFFHLPAILELTLCGICLRQYVDAILLSGSANGSTKVPSFLKLLACICESGILALVLVSIPRQVPTLFSSSHTWNYAFILLSLFIGINCTSLGLFCICWLSSNHSQPSGLLDHFIVYCSALRGLYAFSLALLLGETDLPQKHIMVVTSLFAFIFFAVFVQNLTLKVLQNSLKETPATKQELISPEKLKKNLLDQVLTGFKDVTGLLGYHVLREGIHLYTSVLSRHILMRDHDVTSPSDRRIRLLQLVRKLNLRTWLQHVTAYGGAGSSSSANTTSTPSLPPPATAAAIGAFTCAQASLTISSAGSRGNGTGLLRRQSSQNSSNQSNIGHAPAAPGQRRSFHQKVWGTNQATEFHSKTFVPKHERCCGEDSGVHVDDHSEEEEEDGSHITTSSALGACCGSSSCTGVEGTKFEDDCRIHHSLDHNAYRPRHKWSKLNKKNPGSRPSNYAIFHQELCMQLEKLCSNRPSKNDTDEEVSQKLSCLDQLKKGEVEIYLKNINEEFDDPSSRYLLTTPKQLRDVSPTGSYEEGDKLEQVAEVETAGLEDKTTEDAEFAEDSLGFRYRLPWLDETHSSPPVPPPLVGQTLAEKTLPWKCHFDTAKAPIAEIEEIESEQTLAETTLPWKRQSVREPISAAMSLNVAEDEPQAAEVPSWINNLLYHRLKETGSPYLSPEDTLTFVQTTVSRPSIFSVFPISIKPKQHEDEEEKKEKEEKEKGSASVTTTGRLLPPPLAAEVESEAISLPPPWESHNSGEYEPLTSPHATNTNIGDKVCSSESMHRLLPPTHHIIIPLTPGNTNESISDLESHGVMDRGALRSPSSAPNFPTHWQMLLPHLRDRRHSTSLTEEQAYEEDCLQRVQNWLDNVEPGLDGVVDLDNFEEQHFFLLDDEDHLDETYDADLEDEDLEETIV